MCTTCNCVELPDTSVQHQPKKRGRKCLEVLHCDITRQKLNGFVNRLDRLRKREVISREQINSYLGIITSAFNEKNPCYYYQELGQLDQLLTSHGL